MFFSFASIITLSESERLRKVMQFSMCPFRGHWSLTVPNAGYENHIGADSGKRRGVELVTCENCLSDTWARHEVTVELILPGIGRDMLFS
jgi:hypothetical protein